MRSDPTQIRLYREIGLFSTFPSLIKCGMERVTQDEIYQVLIASFPYYLIACCSVRPILPILGREKTTMEGTPFIFILMFDFTDLLRVYQLRLPWV
jgi:hypothetical protein